MRLHLHPARRQLNLAEVLKALEGETFSVAAEASRFCEPVSVAGESEETQIVEALPLEVNPSYQGQAISRSSLWRLRGLTGELLRPSTQERYFQFPRYHSQSS